MAIYRVQGPDGSTLRIEGPDDATEEQVLAFAQEQYASAPRTSLGPSDVGGPQSRVGPRNPVPYVPPSRSPVPVEEIPNIFSRKPDILERLDGQPATAPDQASVSPRMRAAVEHAWNAGDEKARAELEQRPGSIGEIAQGLRARATTVDRRAFPGAGLTAEQKIDPRIEMRAARLAGQGVDPGSATQVARNALDFEVAPGQELTGTASASSFDFDRANTWESNAALDNPIARGVVKGGAGILQGAVGFGEAVHDWTGSDFRRSDTSSRLAGFVEEVGTTNDPLGRNFEGAVSSIAQQLPALIGGAVTGSEALVLANMALQTFGQEYSRGTAAGLSIEQRTKRAAIFGAAEAVGEKFGLRGWLDKLHDATNGIGDPEELAKFLAGQLRKEIPGELLTTNIQFAADKSQDFGLDQQAGLEQYLKQTGDTIVQTVMQGGLMGGAVAGTAAVARDTQARRAEAAKIGAMDKWSAFGDTLAAKPAPPAGQNFTPADSLVAQAGITPVVVSGAPQEAVTAGVDHPAPLATDEELLSQVATTAPPAEAPAAPSAEPVQTWFGRRGDGYVTEPDAQQALPGRQRMFRDLDWKVEPMPTGKYRIAGYPQGQPAADVKAASPGNGVEAAPVGEKWEAFNPADTAGVPRAEMPQIKAEHRGAMVNFLNARGIPHAQQTVDPNTLKPTQAEYSPEKVQKALDFEGGNRSILVSSDNRILDGHHQWLAAKEKGEPVNVIRLQSPIRHLLNQARAFPSSTLSQETADVTTPEQTSTAVTEQPAAVVPRTSLALSATERSGLSLAIPAPKPVQAAAFAALEKHFGVSAVEDQSSMLRNDGHLIASSIARALGNTYTVIRTAGKDAGEIGGFVNRVGGKHIFVASGVRHAPLTIAVHEGLHALPDDIRVKLEQSLLDLFDMKKVDDFQKDFAYPLDKLDTEIPAKIAEAISTRQDFWEQLHSRLGDHDFKSVAKIILAKLNEIIDKVTARSGQKFVDKYLGDNVIKARDLLADAYAQAMKNERADSPDGQTELARHIRPYQAKQTNVPVEMPSDPLFSEAVANTDGASVTSDGLLMTLVRFQKQEQEGGEAVRTGVFYLPAASKNIKHYRETQSTKSPNAYGGTERFDGETLIRRPLFVKGGTGGKAPEAAYDAMKGKGAAKQLDRDVMAVVTSRYGAMRGDPDTFRELVRNFLRDNGANPSKASAILAYSKQGNTLRYALYENVVAHAVRKAGYDAVVGYTKGKAGVSISEVFDVREQTYPATGIESEVHEDFDTPALARQQREPLGEFESSTAKDGTLTVYGDAAQIRAALPEDVKGRVSEGQIVFTPSAAARVKSVLQDKGVAYGRAGEVTDKLQMKNGRYVGAPAKFDTPAKIPHLRKWLKQLTLEGAPGRYWYENSSKEVLRMVGGDVNEARKFVALLAIYSPQAKVDANSTFALRAWAQYKAGQPISVKTGSQDKKATEAMRDVDAFWSGEKTGNFFFNLLRMIDPSTEGKQGATIDMWMMRAAQYANDAPTSTQYSFMENENNRIAAELGWEPQQVQAAIWVAMKARMENAGVKKATEKSSEKRGWLTYEYPIKNGRPIKTRKILDAANHRENWLKHAYAHDPSTADTQGAKLDFSDGVLRHIGQVSFEARPGRSTGILPGIHSAPYAQQVEFQQAVQRALYDADGRDLLAHKLGLLVDNGDLVSPGVWQGEVSPSNQKQVAMAPAKGDDGKTRVDPAQADLLNVYTSILGLLAKQEGVGWHRPFYTVTRAQANGLDIDIGRPVNPVEAADLEAAVGRWMTENGHEGWGNQFAFVSSPNGVRMINFGAVSNEELRTKVLEAAAAVLPNSETRMFASDGDMPTNNWKESPNGEDYAGRVRAAGRSDVLDWATAVLAPKVDAVFAEFGERYGWGGPALSRQERVTDASGSGRDRSLGQEDLPEYGRRRIGAASVVGYHYSRDERTVLDGSKYGTGMRGAEAQRVAAATDPRIKSRVYFYASKGQGISPEVGVGHNRHEVRLNNIYAAAGDPLNLKKTADFNDFESAVIDAGYDGYMVPFGDQNAVVLLGDHQVPVKHTGYGSVREYVNADVPALSRQDINELGMYSELARQLERGPNVAPKDQWKAYIKGLAQKGVKQDEVEWSGVNEWLDLQQGKVSKQAVLDYVNANGVQVEEVAMGGDAKNISLAQAKAVLAAGGKIYLIPKDAPNTVANGTFDDGRMLSYVERNPDKYWFREGSPDDAYHGKIDTKYGQYQLPGGTNYREILLRLPAKDAVKPERVYRSGADIREKSAAFVDAGFTADAVEAAAKFADEGGSIADGIAIQDRMIARGYGYTAAQKEAGQVLRAIESGHAKRMSDAAIAAGNRTFKSSHWDQSNVLAHIRVNDRTDADGKRVLFVEEIQSDWGQQGKKKGFLGSWRTAYQVVIDGIPAGTYVNRQEADAAIERARKYQEAGAKFEIREVQGKTQGSIGVPTAPYVTKTDAWVALALKRVIAMAAKEGYDSVAFVNGKQSAERYDLSKQIERVSYYHADGFMGKKYGPVLKAFDKHGNEVINKAVDPKDLPDYIGKEIADRLLSDKRDSQGVSQISGAGLQVGGEGMKTFYDVIVPKVVKDLTRKLGGEQRQVDLVSKSYWDIEADPTDANDGYFYIRNKKNGMWLKSVNDEGETTWTTIQEKALPQALGNTRKMITRIVTEGDASLAQPGFDITPAMRAKVLDEGVPLLSRQQAPVNSGPPRFDIPPETTAERFRRIIQDAQFRLRKIQEVVAAQGGTIDERRDAYRAWELMPGRVESVVQRFDDRFVTPFIDAMAKHKVTPAEISLYAYAMHAAERNADIKKRNPQGIMFGGGRDARITTAGSGMTDSDAAIVLKAVQNEGRQKQFDAVYDAMRKLIDVNRNAMLRYGLVDAAEIAAITKKFKHWVPLRGLEHVDHDQDEINPRKGKGLDLRGAETMPAMGRVSRASDILENILTDFYLTATRGERNTVNRVLLDMILANPDPSLWEVDPQTHVREEKKTTGLIEEFMKPETRTDVIALKVAGKPVYVRIKDPLLRRALLDEWRGKMDSAPIKAMMMVNTVLRNTLTRYNPPFAVANAARDVQQAASYIIGELGSKAGARFAASYPKALAAAGRAEFGQTGKQMKAAGVRLFGDPIMDKHYEEFMSSGAITGGFYMKDVEDITRDIHRRLVKAGGPGSVKGVGDAFAYLGNSRIMAGATPNQILRLIEAAGSISENATRFALYHAARSSGATKLVSAGIAKNGTTNFNRKGEWGPMLNTLYLFSGAAIQGARSGLHSIARSKYKGQVAALAASWAGIGLALALMGASVGGDDENGEAYWDMISTEEKRRNWIIMLPPGEAMFDGALRVGARGRYVKVPMPYLWNIFPVMGMGVADAIRHAGSKRRGAGASTALANAAGTAIDNLNPIGGAFDVTQSDDLLLGIMPTIVDIPLQFTLDVNAFGTPTSPSFQAVKIPDHESVTANQAGGWGHETARWLYNVTDPLAQSIGSGKFFDGRGVSMKPGTIENSVFTLTGGTGRFVGDILSTAIHLSDDQNPLTPSSVPFLNKMYGEVGERQAASKAYERARDAKSYADQRAKELGLDYEPRSKYEEAMIAVAGAADAFQDSMSTIRKQQILIMSDATMPKTKRIEESNELRLAMDEAAKGFNAAYLEIMADFEDAE